MTKKLLISILLVLFACGLTVYALIGPAMDLKPEGALPKVICYTADHASEDVIIPGGRMVVGMIGEITDLEPHRSLSSAEKKIFLNFYEGLTRECVDGSIDPAVASGWEQSEDAKTYVFELRENVHFSNGRVVTAEDVAYSVRRYQELMGEYSAVYDIRDVSIEENKIIFTLREPDVEFPVKLGEVAIIPYGTETIEGTGIGTGPFHVQLAEDTGELLLTVNRYYWGKCANLDQITVRFYEDAAQLVQAAIDRDVDFLEHVSPDSELLYDEHYEVSCGYLNSLQQIYLNLNSDIFADARVRQAFNMAVDRAALNELLYGGYAYPCETQMLPEMTAFYNTDTEQVYTYDPEAAAKLLSEAGYPDGLTIHMILPGNYERNEQAAEILAEQAAAAGITLETESVGWERFLLRLYDEKDYETALVCFDGDLRVSTYFKSYVTDEDNNVTGYSSEEYDSIYEQAMHSTDYREQNDLYGSMQMLLTKDSPAIYLAELPNVVLIRKGISGFVSYPDDVLSLAEFYQYDTTVPEEVQEGQAAADTAGNGK